jgi:hypothetical protein
MTDSLEQHLDQYHHHSSKHLHRLLPHSLYSAVRIFLTVHLFISSAAHRRQQAQARWRRWAGRPMVWARINI